MPSERDLRRRVRSVKNIQQLTRAMQLVAASKMRRAQEAVLASRPFEQKLRSVLNELAPYADPEISPLLHRRTPVRKVAVTAANDLPDRVRWMRQNPALLDGVHTVVYEVTARAFTVADWRPTPLDRPKLKKRRKP